MALAKVEVNSGKDILITIRTGSGQGHRLSSILFLVGSEPLIRVNATRFAEIMYIKTEGITIGPILFVDDNLSPTKLQRIEQVEPLLAVYNHYTGVSSLNINVKKVICTLYKLTIRTPSRTSVKRFCHSGHHETSRQRTWQNYSGYHGRNSKENTLGLFHRSSSWLSHQSQRWHCYSAKSL